MFKTLVAWARNAVRGGTPDEMRLADIGAQDAGRGVYDPLLRPEMARAYGRGWHLAQAHS